MRVPIESAAKCSLVSLVSWVRQWVRESLGALCDPL